MKFMLPHLSSFEIILGFVGAAAIKSVIIGLIIIITAGFFCRY